FGVRRDAPAIAAGAGLREQQAVDAPRAAREGADPIFTRVIAIDVLGGLFFAVVLVVHCVEVDAVLPGAVEPVPLPGWVGVLRTWFRRGINERLPKRRR